jgi:signal transduction histidine kinase
VSLSCDDDSFSVSVSDNGVGINSSDFDKLFKKFSQVSNPLTTTVNGSGLGLYLVKKMVDLHHGSISVDSEIGRGSTFTVRLPKGEKYV